MIDVKNKEVRLDLGVTGHPLFCKPCYESGRIGDIADSPGYRRCPLFRPRNLVPFDKSFNGASGAWGAMENFLKEVITEIVKSKKQQDPNLSAVIRVSDQYSAAVAFSKLSGYSADQQQFRMQFIPTYVTVDVLLHSEEEKDQELFHFRLANNSSEKF